MLKKRVLSLASIALFFTSTLLTSCYSSQQLVQPSLTEKVSRNPAFLDGVPLSGPDHVVALSSQNMKNDGGSKIDVTLTNAIQVKFASLMEVMPQTISNIPLYSFVNEWYGTRYRLGGTDKSGIDCSAFVKKCYESIFGMSLLRTAFEQFNMSNLIWKNSDLKEGDLVFFRIHSSRISHVGIYLMNNFFVHASSSRGVMISNLNENYWQKYYACGGRLL
jgi:lipoprotein Spr